MTRRILVIDDEMDIRDVVCLSLEAFGGWQTTAAASGRAGLVQAATDRWDAILLDVSMPDMDGFTVYAQLQDNPRTRNIPVVLLTAKVLASDRDRFSTLGVAGVITKPFDPTTVWLQVAQILGWAT